MTGLSAIRTFNVEAGLPTLDESRRLVIEEISRRSVTVPRQHGPDRCSLFSTFVSSVRIRRQRNAYELLIVSSINILMSKSGSSPGDLSTAKQPGWLDQLRAADFLVAAGGQTGLNKFAPVVKE
jgi:hypothetical protein